VVGGLAYASWVSCVSAAAAAAGTGAYIVAGALRSGLKAVQVATATCSTLHSLPCPFLASFPCHIRMQPPTFQYNLLPVPSHNSCSPPRILPPPPPAVLSQFVAFFSVAFVAYYMRTRHGYRSLPEAIHARYGGFAALAFGLAVAYRWGECGAAAFAGALLVHLPLQLHHWCSAGAPFYWCNVLLVHCWCTAYLVHCCVHRIAAALHSRVSGHSSIPSAPKNTHAHSSYQLLPPLPSFLSPLPSPPTPAPNCCHGLHPTRLEQEVWSNSLVVASFYGPVHSTNWWLAAIVSTAIPAFYCFTGGMRASLFTDVFQVRLDSTEGQSRQEGRGILAPALSFTGFVSTHKLCHEA
jgi:hypothetical protein